MNGLNFDALGIFPQMEYPVPRGTPMLSPLVTWDHSMTFDLPDPANFLTGGHGQLTQSRFIFVMGDDKVGSKDSYLLDRRVSGLAVFPESGYLVLAWKCLARYLGQFYETMPVQLEDIKFHRPTLLPDTGKRKIHLYL